jgi:hypothetical protein
MQVLLRTMKIAAAFSSLLANASAHTIFTQLHVNGVAQGHTKGIRVPVSIDLSIPGVMFSTSLLIVH